MPTADRVFGFKLKGMCINCGAQVPHDQNTKCLLCLEKDRLDYYKHALHAKA